MAPPRDPAAAALARALGRPACSRLPRSVTAGPMALAAGAGLRDGAGKSVRRRWAGWVSRYPATCTSQRQRTDIGCRLYAGYRRVVDGVCQRPALISALSPALLWVQSKPSPGGGLLGPSCCIISAAATRCALPMGRRGMADARPLGGGSAYRCFDRSAGHRLDA